MILYLSWLVVAAMSFSFCFPKQVPVCHKLQEFYMFLTNAEKTTLNLEVTTQHVLSNNNLLEYSFLWQESIRIDIQESKE